MVEVHVAAAALAFLVAAGATPPAPRATRPQDRVIFRAEVARTEWKGFASPDDFWTPALSDALALEQRLPDHLRRELAHTEDHTLWRRAPLYKRQYVGIRKQGRRTILANFFCDTLRMKWRTNRYEVFDGGDCFFQIEYDVDEQTFSNLMINGKA